MLDRYLKQLSEELKLPTPPIDEQKRYHVAIGDQKIVLKELDPGVYFSTEISPVPPHRKEDLCMLLMRANFLGQGTGGGTIGMSEDESLLTLSLAIPYEMNYKTFHESLEDFANFVDYWKKEVSKFKHAVYSWLDIS